MVDLDAWTGLIHLYQVLEQAPSTTDRLSEDHYTVLTLEHLLLMNVIDLLQALRPTAVEQLSYALEPFFEENQVEFLKKVFFFVVSNGLLY